jgi:hypothetical protein
LTFLSTPITNHQDAPIIALPIAFFSPRQEIVSKYKRDISQKECIKKVNPNKSKKVKLNNTPRENQL